MRKILTLLLLTLASSCMYEGFENKPVEESIYSEKAGNRIMLIGDSWAQLMFQDVDSTESPLQSVLNENAYEQYHIVGQKTAIGGSRAHGWVSEASLGLISSELEAYPDVDIIHLSLGGNDFLETALLNQPVPFLQIKANLKKVIHHILSVRPGLKIVMVGYTRLNVKPAIWGSSDHLNKLLQILELGKFELAQEIDRVYYSYHLDYQNPPYHHDGAHLSHDGYKRMAQKLFDSYYRYWLKGQPAPEDNSARPAYPFYSNAPGKRILYVGDSWTEHMWKYWSSLADALAEKGLAVYEPEGGKGALDIWGGTAIGGSTAYSWLSADLRQRIKNQLDTNPTIDIVHLSLGGNDVLVPQDGNMLKITDSAFHDEIALDIKNTIDFILNLKPNMKVALVGYSYLKKEYPLVPGASTVFDMNNNVIYPLEKRKYELVQSYNSERVRYIDNLGLFRNPPEIVMSDAIHHNNQGFDIIGRNCVEKIYQYWLKGLPAPEQPALTAPVAANQAPVIAGHTVTAINVSSDFTRTEIHVRINYSDFENDKMTIFYANFTNGWVTKADDYNFIFTYYGIEAGSGGFDVVVNDGYNSSAPYRVNVSWQATVPPVDNNLANLLILARFFGFW